MSVLNRALLAGTSTLVLALALGGVSQAGTIVLDGTSGKTSYTGTGNLTGDNGSAGAAGVNGSGAEGDWSVGIFALGANTSVTVQSGTVSAGVGGKGGAGAAGAYNGGSGGHSIGVDLAGAGSSLTIYSGTIVTGGTGGAGGAAGGAGGTGGRGGSNYGVRIYGDNVSLTNYGYSSILAGAGGVGGAANGGTAGESAGGVALRIGSLPRGGSTYVGANANVTNYGTIASTDDAAIDIYSSGASITNNRAGTIYTKNGESAVFINHTADKTSILNFGTIKGESTVNDSNAISNIGTNTTITNYGVITKNDAGGDAIYNEHKTTLINYGKISGGIGASTEGDTLIFDGSQGGAQVELGIAGQGGTLATVLFRNGMTTLSGGTEDWGGNGASYSFKELIDAADTVTIKADGALSLASGGYIGTKNGFINDGAFDLGKHAVTIGGYVTEYANNGAVVKGAGGAITGAGVIRTNVGSGTHGYIINDGNTASDFSKMTVVPVVEGSGVKNGSKYVLVQNYGGSAGAPTVTKAGGFIWSSAVSAANGQTDTDGVSYGSVNSAIIISAAQNELVANAANTANAGGAGGAPVRALAGYLGENADLLALSLAVNNLTSEGDIRKASAQLRPETNGATTQAALGVTSQALGTIQTRSDTVRAAMRGETGVATGEAALNAGMWGQFFGGVASQGERKGEDGYDSATRGLAFGFDSAVSDAVRAGVSLAYARTNVDDSGNRQGSGQDIDSWIASIYGSYTASSWYLDGSATVGLHKYDGNRLVNFTGATAQTAKSSYDGRQYGARTEFGAPLAAGDVTVTPLASLAYNHLSQDGYTETGASAANLTVGGVSTNSLRSGLGAKMSTTALKTGDWGLTPNARAVWLHEFIGSAQNQTSSFVAGGSSFNSTGTNTARDHLNLGLGIDAASAGNITLSARYDADLADAFVGHSGMVQVRVNF